MQFLSMCVCMGLFVCTKFITFGIESWLAWYLHQKGIQSDLLVKLPVWKLNECNNFIIYIEDCQIMYSIELK